MMRLLLAVLMLSTFALPAHAQRVDTRRYLVGDQSEGPLCRFTAIPELRLSHRPDSPADLATWQPEGTPVSRARALNLTLLFVRGPEEKALVSAIGFTLYMPSAFASPPVSARVFVDGNDALETFAFRAGRKPPPGERQLYHVNPVGSLDAQRFAGRLAGAKEAAVELLDAKGAVLARYAWDVAEARRIPELLELVHWRCDSPDRG